MAADEKQQTPAEYEKKCLSKIEEQNNVMSSRTQAFANNIPFGGHSSQQIAAFISQLQEWEKYFLTFRPAADYLNKAGLPRTSLRLTAILTDLHSAIQIEQQTYQNAVNGERECNRIAYNGQRAAFDIYRQGIKERQNVFDISNQRWSNVFNSPSLDRNYCSHCGYEIVNYQSYAPCPHCGQMLS